MEVGRQKVFLGFSLAIAGIVGLTAISSPRAQEVNRRQILKTPGLVLETGVPTATTWALTYTNDGKHLLAAGDDKVVRQWPTKDDGIDTTGLLNMRWQNWREWRGVIYAMALSQDAAQKHVAIGGWGAINGNVVILDRATGKVAYGISPPEALPEFGGLTYSLAFSPKGDELAIGKDNGTIWIWSFEKKGAVVRKVGGHPGKGESLRVRALRYLAANQLVSAAQDGSVMLWTPQGPAGGNKLFDLKIPSANVVALSKNQLAAAAWDAAAAEVAKVEIWSLGNRQSREINLPEGSVVEALSFSTDGKRLAVGVDLKRKKDVAWHPRVCEVQVFDIGAAASKKIANFPASYNVTGLAFHPTNDDQLAVAGGNQYEVSVFDVEKKKSLQVIRGPGSALWSVGLSKDNSQLGYRSKRNLDPPSHNSWGSGDWNVFDLKGRKWANEPKEFQPITPLDKAAGWSVDASHDRDWVVVSPTGKRHKLPLIYAQDHLPTCYTFIQPPGGGVQLAVGHRWGISIFACAEQGVRRIRVGYGHAGETTAVAPSADHKLLVSASRDQTICSWSLLPLENQRELGASFTNIGGRAVVTKVMDGSPAWEAGLAKGDEISVLKINALQVNGVKDMLNQLTAPTPNIELFFVIDRPGLKGQIKMLTTVRQRPIWRFLPLDNREWVLYRYRDYFYDTSAKGDFYIGWQVLHAVGETPDFFKAEQFRKDRHRPDKVEEAIQSAFYRPEQMKLAPPKVELVVNEDAAGADIPVEIKVEAQGPEAIDDPSVVSLWINDYKMKSWPGNAQFNQKVMVPRALLRTGQKNILTAQAYTSRGQRGDSQRQEIDKPGQVSGRKLHGVFVGVSNYTRAARGPKGEFWGNLLFPPKDAQAVHDAWLNQTKNQLYTKGHVVFLQDFEASRARILSELTRLQGLAKPDDRVVVFLAGHGWAQRLEGKKEIYNPNRFAFATPEFDIARFKDTGLTSEVLYEGIAGLPAHKLLFLDACHSGSVTGADFVRGLTPDGIGPPIFTAAERDDVAWEHPKIGHGVFTRALLDALDEDFELADRDQDRELNALEIGQYMTKRVPDLLKKLIPYLGEDGKGAKQHPQIFPDMTINHRELIQPLARGKLKVTAN